jgi:hypothetical protein
VGREVLKLKAELLQQQQEERRDRQRQPAGEVGDEEHELLGGEIAEGSGAGADPSGERRRAPSEQVAHQIECPLGLEMLGMNQRSHGDYGGGKQKSANAKGRRGLGGERAQQIERMQKRNCCTRGESLFKEDSPARAPGNPVRHAPSAQATESIIWGPGPTSHVAGMLVSECGRSKPSHGERTTTHDRAPPRGRCEKIFINRGGSNEAPRAWPDGTARRGAVGQSAAGTDVAVDVTEGGLTARMSPDALS